jgi:hypothetical protein
VSGGAACGRARFDAVYEKEMMHPLDMKVKKLMRKTRRNRGCNSDFYVIHVSPTKQPQESHIGEELTGDQRENFRLSIDDDFPE